MSREFQNPPDEQCPHCWSGRVGELTLDVKPETKVDGILTWHPANDMEFYANQDVAGFEENIPPSLRIFFCLKCQHHWH